MRLTTVALALAALLGAITAAAAPSASSPMGLATIRGLGGGALFLDKGARDGLAAGAVIDVTRRGRVVGRCSVDAVADHSARCAFADPAALTGRTGDRVRFPRVAVVDEAPAPSPPLVADEGVLHEARAVVEATTAPKVAFARSRRRGGAQIASRLSITGRGQTFAVIGGGDSVFVRPSLDVGGRVALGLLPGLYASTAARLQGDVLAPANERFRNGTAVDAWVWDASVGLQPSRSGVLATAGRFRPQRAPGMTVLDGAALGFMAFGGALEVGAFGGLIPDPITTAPSLDRVTVGTWFSVETSPWKGLLLLPRGRIGLVTSSDLQRTRAEAEAQLQALWTNVVAVSGSVRLGLPGDTAVPTLDAARLDIDVTPLRSLRARVGLRTVGAMPGDLDTGVTVDGTTLLPTRAAHHGDAAVQWSLSDDVILGATAAVAADAETGDLRALVGPELALPRLVGDGFGLSLGLYEEPATGDSLAGRSGFVQATSRPLPEWMPGLVWSLRTSVFDHATATATDGKVGLGGALREVLVMTHVMAPLSSWLSLQGRAHGLFAIVDTDGFGATPVGTFVDLGLTASF